MQFAATLALLSLAAPLQGAHAQTFGPFDVSGQRRTHWVNDYRAPAPAPGSTVLRNPKNEGNLVRYCTCSGRAVDGDVASSDGLKMCLNSNSSPNFLAKWWVYGQFISHELVATVEEIGCANPTVLPIEPEYPFAPKEMFMCPLVGESAGCPTPVNTMRPGITGDTIYSPDEAYLQNVLREPGTCLLRTQEGNQMPTAEFPGGNVTWVSGDLRVSQHCALMGVHTVWVREHNRLCSQMMTEAAFASMTVDEKFARAKNVVVAKLQQVTLQWLGEIGITKENVCEGITAPPDAKVSVEFATVAMRIGHAMIGDAMGGHAMYDTFQCDLVHKLNDGVESTFNGQDIATYWTNQMQSTPIYETDGKGSRLMCLHEFGPTISENQIVKNTFRNQDQQMPSYGQLATCMGVTKNPEVGDTEMAYVGALAETKGLQVSKENGVGPLNMAIIKKQFCGVFRSGPVWWNDVASIDGFQAEVEAASVTTVEDANTNSHMNEGIGFSRKNGGTGPPKFTGFKIDPTVQPKFAPESSSGGSSTAATPASAPAPAPVPVESTPEEEEEEEETPGGGGTAVEEEEKDEAKPSALSVWLRLFSPRK